MKTVFLATLCGIALTSSAFADADMASAELINGSEKNVGTVTLEQTPNGVLLTANLKGLPAGEHSFHIHETGSCKAPGFKSAGGHFSPRGKKHGFRSASGPHAGDLPNLFVLDDGKARATVFNDRVTLKKGEDHSLFDKDGSAIVIHAEADDYATDPAGKGGKRIACGVIKSKGD